MDFHNVILRSVDGFQPTARVICGSQSFKPSHSNPSCWTIQKGKMDVVSYLVCVHVHGCTTHTHRRIRVPDSKVNHKPISWTLSSRSNIDPFFLSQNQVAWCQQAWTVATYHALVFSISRWSHLEPSPLTGDQLGQWTPYPWAYFLSPVIIHPPRTTLALITPLSFLISVHLLFTEGLSFFLDPKTVLHLEKQNMVSSAEN